jgi:hypothetical protein
MCGRGLGCHGSPISIFAQPAGAAAELSKHWLRSCRHTSHTGMPASSFACIPRMMKSMAAAATAGDGWSAASTAGGISSGMRAALASPSAAVRSAAAAAPASRSAAAAAGCGPRARPLHSCAPVVQVPLAAVGVVERLVGGRRRVRDAERSAARLELLLLLGDQCARLVLARLRVVALLGEARLAAFSLVRHLAGARRVVGDAEPFAPRFELLLVLL